MSLCSDQFQDAPDAISYLNDVKAYLGADKSTLHAFLAEVAAWLDIQKSQDSCDSDACLSRIATHLKCHAKLLQGFNALLEPGQSLECSTIVEGDAVKFFVLVDDHSARIIPTAGWVVPFPSSDIALRNIIRSKETWKKLLHPIPDKDWLICISQVLQVILDDPSTDAECHRRTYRCLRELASESILPPSIFVNNLTRGRDHPVQGGAFADIYKGNMRGTPVCFRVLRMFAAPSTDHELLYKDFCSEVLVWRQLKHVNILPFIGANLELFSPKFCFISPWLRNGDIMLYLKEHPDHNRFTSVCEIVEGIDYLHSLDPPVTHKDIKGANVLVRDDLMCCLADFGLSSIVESQRLGRGSETFEGSVPWAAPEIMNPSRYAVKDATAGDIYALACTVYEIYTGKAPFLDTHTRSASIIFSVMNGERPALPPPGEWSPDEEMIWWLVGLCWKDQPQDRPAMTLIKNTLRDIGMHSSQNSVGFLVDIKHTRPEVDLDNVRHWLQRELSRACKQPQEPSSLGMDLSQSLLQHAESRTLATTHVCQPYRHDQTIRQTLYPQRSIPVSGPVHSLRPIFVPPPTHSTHHSLGLLTPTTPSSRPEYVESDNDSDSVRVAQVYERRRSRMQSPETHESFQHPPTPVNPTLPSILKLYAPFTPPSTPLQSPPEMQDVSPESTLAVCFTPPSTTLIFPQNTNRKADILPSASQEHSPSRLLNARPPLFFPTHLRQARVAHGPRPRATKSSATFAEVSFNLGPSPLGQSAADQDSRSIRHASPFDASMHSSRR